MVDVATAMPKATVREDFQLQIMAHRTQRQFGATLNIFCRYRYRSSNDTFDYRDARATILRTIDANNTAVPQVVIGPTTAVRAFGFILIICELRLILPICCDVVVRLTSAASLSKKISAECVPPISAGRLLGGTE
jgi:hypothetical protein